MYYTQTVENIEFRVQTKYQDLKKLGSGRQGVVISAFDTIRKERVAIKKLTKYFRNETYAKRVFRELKLLKIINHKTS